MAGPGGGPPRKRHTKSRKGCETCKRRHIRCDENVPQCRNCTKHNCRCPYMEVLLQEERTPTPEKADLSWAPEVEAEIECWQQPNSSLFPEFYFCPSSSPQYLSFEELSLLYSSVPNKFGIYDLSNFAIGNQLIEETVSVVYSTEPWKNNSQFSPFCDGGITAKVEEAQSSV